MRRKNESICLSHQICRPSVCLSDDFDLRNPQTVVNTCLQHLLFVLFHQRRLTCGSLSHHADHISVLVWVSGSHWEGGGVPDQQGPRCVRLSLLCGNISIIGGGVKTRGACGTADITPTLRQQHLTTWSPVDNLFTFHSSLEITGWHLDQLWDIFQVVVKILQEHWWALGTWINC